MGAACDGGPLSSRSGAIEKERHLFEIVGGAAKPCSRVERRFAFGAGASEMRRGERRGASRGKVGGNDCASRARASGRRGGGSAARCRQTFAGRVSGNAADSEAGGQAREN